MSKSATDVGQFVTVNPSGSVQFKPGVKQTYLAIKNSSPTKNIVFKVRTTQPLSFVVKPNQGIVEADSETQVEINYVPNPVSITLQALAKQDSRLI